MHVIGFFINYQSLIKIKTCAIGSQRIGFISNTISKLRDWDLQYTKEIVAQIAKINDEAVKEIYQL
jgi:hypothetical protein